MPTVGDGLFEAATFEEKQELLRFLLSNSAMDGENLVPSIKKPFDILFECQKTKDWLPVPKINISFMVEIDKSIGKIIKVFQENHWFLKERLSLISASC